VSTEGTLIRGQWFPAPPRWFIFGENQNGTVDVSDGEADVLTAIPRLLAEQIIAARDDHVDMWMARNQEIRHE
jgi:hypothetical protein